MGSSDDNKTGTVKWEKGNNSADNKKGQTISNGSRSVVTLLTNGKTGSGSVKVSVPNVNGKGTDELVVTLKVVKAVDFGSDSVNIVKSGSKTYAERNNTSGSVANQINEKNIANYDIRTSGDVYVKDGIVGRIEAGGEKITVEGGRAGVIDAGDDTVVDITEDAIAGDQRGTENRNSSRRYLRLLYKCVYSICHFLCQRRVIIYFFL